MKFGAYSDLTTTGKMDFGYLTYGFPDGGSGVRTTQLPFEAKVSGGTYENVLRFAKENGQSARAAIVTTDGAGGENAFVKALSAVLDCPVVGGGAARGFGVPGDGLFCRRGQADICLLFGDRPVHTSVRNIHTQILAECDLAFDDPRVLQTINGENASDFLRKQKEEYGLAAEDFEHMTLCTQSGVNAHMREENGVILSGRDLEKKMLLRFVPADEVRQQMEEFYQEDSSAIVFGCAGLKGITPEAFSCESTGLFLFGEICALEGTSEFGNLMLSKLVC